MLTSSSSSSKSADSPPHATPGDLSRLLLCLLGGLALGCPARDNPYDPGRCDPSCADCYNGRCLSSSDGSAPQPDGGSGGYPIYYGFRSGLEISVGGTPTDLDVPPFKVSAPGDYLLILNAPETWCTGSLASCSGTLCIVDEGVGSVACSHFSAKPEQRVPITVVGVWTVYEGTHRFKAQWYRDTGDALKIGASPTWLVGLRADGMKWTTASNESYAYSPTDWADLPFDPSPLTVDSDGQDYLLVLSVPHVWSTETGAASILWYQVLVDGTPRLGGVSSGASYSQRVPSTLFGKVNLSAGTHQIRAQWKSAHGVLGAAHRAKLVALPVQNGIDAKERPASQASITPGGVSDTGIPAITLESGGGEHLFILNAADTWCEVSGTWTGGWASFQIQIDGAPLPTPSNLSDAPGAVGLYSGVPGQRIPTNVIGVSSLTPGKHQVTAGWQCGGTGISAWQGAANPSRLLVFAP